MAKRRFAAAAAALARAQELLATSSNAGFGRVRSLRSANELALGNALRGRGALDGARAAYGRALRSARSLRHALLEAATLNNLGSLALRVGAPRRARRQFARALVAARRFDRQQQRRFDRAARLRLLARVHNGAGSAELALHRVARARRHFARAKSLADRAASKRDALLARIGLARCDERLGKRAAALDALAAAEREAARAKLTDVLLVARVDRAAVAVRAGEHGQALRSLDAARSQLGAVADASQRAALMHDLGAVYFEAGMYDEALGYYRRALAAAFDPAFTISVAGAQLASGQLAAAAKTLDSLAATALAARPHLSRRARWLGGWLALRQGAPSRAAQRFQAVCSPKGPRGLRRRADCALARGAAALARQDAKGALATLRRARALQRRLADGRGELASLDLIGQARSKLGQIEAAIVAYRAAAQLVERTRPRLGSDLLKMGYLSDQQQLYRRLLALLSRGLSADGQVSEAHAERLLSAMERSRGRGLLDLIHDGRLSARRAMTPAQRELDALVQRRLARVQLLQQRLGRSDDAAVLDKTQRALAEAVRRLDAARLRQRAGMVALRRATPPLVRLAALRAAARSGDQVFVAYYLQGDLALSLLVAPGGVRARRLSHPRTLARQAGLLTQLIRARQDGPEVRRAFSQLSRSLYKRLLAADADLIGKRPLVVIGDGALAGLPFSVLLYEAPTVDVSNADYYSRLPYLIVRNTVSYAPSLSIWTTLQRGRGVDASRTKLARALRVGSFLGLGDPRWRRSAKAATKALHQQGKAASWPALRGLRWLRHLLRGDALPPLPHARREVVDIARGLGGSARALTGRAASESALKRALRREAPSVLHLAVHGMADDEKPQFSSLVLSPSSRDDGLLELIEIYGLPLGGVELTVLSACRTALGRRVAGEGVVGLVRGFLAAGSRSVVASLWSVSDESTRELMQRFYRETRRARTSPAVALARAQQAAARGKLGRRFAQPFFWAPFGLYGGAPVR